MDDNNEQTPAENNIRTLIYYLGLAIDERLLNLRRGTAYENVRASDVRVFVTAVRRQRSISEIARELKITRQAAQMSVQRLAKLNVVELQTIPGNLRDKRVAATPRGLMARNTAAKQIAFIEQEFAAVIGDERLEMFRDCLTKIIRRLNDNVAPSDPDTLKF